MHMYTVYIVHCKVSVTLKNVDLSLYTPAYSYKYVCLYLYSYYASLFYPLEDSYTK